MNREKIILSLILLGLLFVLLFSFFIGLLFRELYILLILITIACAAIFIFIMMYVRIQHNLDKKFSSVQDNLDKKFNKIEKEEINIYNGIVDFLDNLLNHLTENKKEIGDVLDKVDEEFVKIKELLEDQKEQANVLKNEIKNGSRKKVKDRGSFKP